MKKIVLKNEACIGCGACVGIDGEHFEFSDEGYSVIKSQENLDSPALSDAIDACPVAIISLEEVSMEEVTEAREENLEPEKKSCECEPCHCEECHCEEDTCPSKEEEKEAA